MNLDGSVQQIHSVRLEASTLCQLRCPLCPNISVSPPGSVIGKGYLTAQNFKRLVDKNPQLRRIELSSKGEVFLNPDLPEILDYAGVNHITPTMNTGVNMNHASERALEALVTSGTAVVRCSIDGVTQKTYEAYRVGGKLQSVLENIRKINRYKNKHGSSKPFLIFQFIVFGHNEHEVEQAMILARMLNMRFEFRLNRVPEFMPVRNRERIKKLAGYADRHDYYDRRGRNYLHDTCLMLWKFPQINWDGKLLGCACNLVETYAENVFEHDLLDCLNNNKMRGARRLLMGLETESDVASCRECDVYASRKHYGKWVTREEILSMTPENFEK